MLNGKIHKDINKSPHREDFLDEQVVQKTVLIIYGQVEVDRYPICLYILIKRFKKLIDNITDLDGGG
mgnify:CR=1 FL=1